MVWKWHALFSYAATTWMDQLEGIHHHIAGVPFAVRSRAVVKRDNGHLSNGEKVDRLACVASQLILVAIGSGKSKDVHA
jgi:hypothetical protein